MNKTLFWLVAALAAWTVAACAPVAVQEPSPGHLRGADLPPVPQNIPKPLPQTAAIPKPKPTPRTETYSVVVNNVRVQDLLFALARDARLNVDVHPGISGTVTLNAIDQTLPQLLNRIGKQVDMRYELDGPNLLVRPDTPYLRTYRIDYVNMARDVNGTVSINTQIATGAPGASGGSTGTATGGGQGANTSLTEIRNVARNRFWESLEKNIKELLYETDKLLPEGSSETVIERADVQSTTGTGALSSGAGPGNAAAQPSLAASPNPATLQSGGTTVVRRATFREAASVIVNPENGIVTVRATSRQHEKVQEFLDSVMSVARRQVLIEATIVEVELGDNYQQGIEWSRLRPDDSGFRITGPTLPSDPTSTVTPFILRYLDTGTGLNLSVTLRLLEAFGDVKVISSPKLSVLNNQTAILRVVENIVYFNVKTDTIAGTGGSQAITNTTTTPQSVSVGLVMSVTPQVSDDDVVTLNVRPTISAVASFVEDPNPDLQRVGAPKNLVPQIRTREVESIMRVPDGDIAVLGGLMEDRVSLQSGRVPLIGDIPVLGEIFTTRNNTARKTELVIFLRPIIVRDASLAGDYRGFREQLPDRQFFPPPSARRPFPPPSGAGQ